MDNVTFEEENENGYWTPDFIGRDMNLLLSEKVVLAIITQYYKKYKKCYLSNEYFMPYLSTQRRQTVLETLNSLAKKGYIIIEKSGHKRLLTPIPEGFATHFNCTNSVQNCTDSVQNGKKNCTNSVQNCTDSVRDCTDSVQNCTDSVQNCTLSVTEKREKEERKENLKEKEKRRDASEEKNLLSSPSPKKNFEGKNEKNFLGETEKNEENQENEKGGAGDFEEVLVMPFVSEVFLENWQDFILQRNQTGKHRHEPLTGIEQKSLLRRLKDFGEEYAIILLKKATHGDYLTAIFRDTQEKYQNWLNQKTTQKQSTNTQNHYGTNNKQQSDYNEALRKAYYGDNYQPKN